jgi:thiol:disulfide interchange protein
MTSQIIRALLVFFLLCPALCGQFGQDDAFSFDSGDPVSFRAVVDNEAVAPGDSFHVAVVIEMEKEWHVYANPKGPGTGMETVVTGVDDRGFRFGPALYLPGHRISQEEIAPGDWVYAWEGEVPVFFEVKTDGDLEEGDRKLRIKVSLLACRQSCRPFDEEITLTVRIAGKGEGTKPVDDPVFRRFSQAKPALREGKTKGAESAAGTTNSSAGTAGEAGADGPSVGLSGETVDFSRYQSRELEKGGGIGGAWMAILLGFVAGLFLNVMPCVLPVISIKIMSLVTQAHEEKQRIFGLGLAFAAGILTVFLILAGLAAGVGMSWGAHFQSETFIVVMLSVVFVFALGMFDVYLILLPGGGGGEAKEGYVGSFLKGVLATLLATPCSGPFLGATLAWALSQTPLVIFLVFTSIGIGMAIPYVLLTAMPGLLKFVPKPGAWMQTFKQIMGFVLFGTVVYLFTILRAELVGPVLAYCLILAFGAFLWGKYATIVSPPRRRWSWRVALLLFAAAGAYVCFMPSESEEIDWEPFSLQALQRHQAEGRAVMIDFTADWCPNCKLVEKTRLESEEVLAALKEKAVVPLLADITRSPQDSPVIRFRNHLGSRSIPFLAIFPPGEPNEPYILRDIYSVEDVLAILEKCTPVEGEDPDGLR